MPVGACATVTTIDVRARVILTGDRMRAMSGESSPTALLLAWRHGDAEAFQRLVPLLHDELHRIAVACMARESDPCTLQPTALVNEAYLRLMDVDRIAWRDRTHFLAMAARTMRRVLVDAARARGSRKRGGDATRVTFDDLTLATADGLAPDLLDLDGALERLASLHPRPHDVVELRFFGGLNVDEAATVLGVSPDTVKRDWRFAKMWLLRELTRREPRSASRAVPDAAP